MSKRNGFTYELSKLVVGHVYEDNWSENPMQYLGEAVLLDGDDGCRIPRQE